MYRQDKKRQFNDIYRKLFSLSFSVIRSHSRKDARIQWRRWRCIWRRRGKQILHSTPQQQRFHDSSCTYYTYYNIQMPKWTDIFITLFQHNSQFLRKYFFYIKTVSIDLIVFFIQFSIFHSVHRTISLMVFRHRSLFYVVNFTHFYFLFVCNAGTFY